jgi:hypothetical protein
MVQPRIIDIPLMRAAQVYLADIIWSAADGPIPQPLSIEQATLGDRTLNVNPMNLSAGVGYPHSGKKSNHVFGTPGVDMKLGVDLLRDIHFILDQIQSGRVPIPLVNWTLKDEPIKRGKILSGDVRVFAAGQTAYLWLWRMFFGPIIGWFQENRHKMHCKVGLNASSKEWDKFVRALKAMEKALFVDGDYPKFDKLLGFALNALEVWLELLIRSGYSKEHITICHALMMGAQFYCVEIRGDIYYFTGSIPSGIYGTVNIDSTAESLLEVMVYLWCYLKYSGESLHVAMGNVREKFPFELMIALANYGDDNLKAVCAKILHFYNQTTHAEGFKYLGFAITDAQDKSIPPRFKESLEECEFLKRGFKYDDDMGYTAPLNIKSIYKMLSYRVAGDLDAETHLHVIVNEAQRHMFLHGRVQLSELQSTLLLSPSVQHTEILEYEDLKEMYLKCDLEGVPFTSADT